MSNKQKTSKEFQSKENTPFIPKKGEEELYHIELTKSITVSGQKITTEKQIQKMKSKAFNQFNANAARIGYEVEILHAPEKD